MPKLLCRENQQTLERIDYGEELKRVDCLIAGGETGPGARPSDPDTFRSDRDQCAAAGVDFFFKSWGWYFGRGGEDRILDGRTHDDLPWHKTIKEMPEGMNGT